MIRNIPTNLMLGFLGVGKTTAILDCLARKPSTERWAILVNEFGEVGIDGALLEGRGATLREVPGGCMCCVAGVPMQVGLNLLLQQAHPDRLLIETSGLGHPTQLLATLSGERYSQVLDLKASIALVDPRQLQDSRYLNHPVFQDQIAVADVLVGSKLDLCSREQIAAFVHWAEHQQPPKRLVLPSSTQGIPLESLDLPRNGARQAGHPLAHANVEMPLPVLSFGRPEVGLAPGSLVRRQQNQGQGYFGCGWVFAEHTRFSYVGLVEFCRGLQIERLKAVMLTERGWCIINAVDGAVAVQPASTASDSRLEVIARQKLDWSELEAALLALRFTEAAD